MAVAEEMEIEEPKAQRSHNRLQGLFDAIRSHPRYVWTLCAGLSLLSSKYLLVDLNVHFPLHLHLLQLATTALLSLSLSTRRHQTSAEAAKRPTVVGWLFLVVLASLMAASTAMTTQAILHFQNMPTLVMLSTVSFLAEDLITRGSSSSRPFLEPLRLAVLAVSCAGILVGEYRLLPRGLWASIPAALLIGLSKALYTIGLDRLPEAVSDARRINTLTCLAGSVIVAVWYHVHGEEATYIDLHSRPGFFKVLRWEYAPLILLNALSTGTAFTLGRSVLFPIYNKHDSGSTSQRAVARAGDTLSLLFLAGMMGSLSTLMLRRSYMTYYQLFAFLLAVICIGGRSVVNALSNKRRDDRKGYTALSAFAGLDSFDSENTAVSETTDPIPASGIHEDRKGVFVRALILGIVATFLWTILPILNFTERPSLEVTTSSPKLDLEYNPAIATEIVLSMYKEPIEEVTTLVSTLRNMPSLSDSKVHIYIKDDEADSEKIKQLTGADKVTSLPNIGREGETYLYHILHEWDNLAKHTVFLQADVHNPREFYPRIQDYFDPARTGMLSMGWSGHLCNCAHCGDRWQFWDNTHLFPRIHARINNNSNATSCAHVLLSYKGQFIVSAKRVRGAGKPVYEYLHDAFVDENSWAHQQEYLQGRPDSMNAPDFGYTMERMWNLVFQCESPDVAWKCPTLLSGKRAGGSVADCQCMDPEV
ncbi:hypothetical protein BDV95DRAFT_112948 [Massariosphaeria phaeospora]|uniref:Uncharacterized protein n=1 Tax=Massariosphaeria phaeospora TaxID=100035 RepID=A0A7C8M6Y8_9PLEO|nr:hypothetical protein BDV95DRAFT_112948 [Massariosphaeria phaeospora]